MDREEELEVAAGTVLRGSNVLVMGIRGIGKSSFLSRLEWQLEQDGSTVIALDGRLAESAHDFLQLLVHRLATHGTLPLSDAPRPNANMPANGAQLLLDDLRGLRDVLQTDVTTVVLVDEVPSPEVGRTLFGRLRDELWELPLAWVVAADAAQRASFIEPPADAFWTRIVELGPFDERAARELLHRRLDKGQLSNDVVDTLLGQASGNPRTLISLAHDVALEGRATQAVVAEQQRREDTAAALGAPARRVLDELEAHGPASASDAAFLQRLSWTRGRAAQVLRELERAGLVTASSRPGKAGRPKRIYEVKRG